MLNNYIVVGRRIDDDGIKYLYGEGTDTEHVCTSPEKDGVKGTPLTVEFIGRKMVELSEAPHLVEGTDAYNRMTGLIKDALIVRPPTGHNPSDAELQAIWEKTIVKLDYDERAVMDGDDVDTNIRKFVVPVADTLAFREGEIAALDNAPGFEPPLTYDLDRRLMKAYFGDIFGEIIDEATDGAGNPLSDDVKSSLRALTDEKLGNFEELENSEDSTKQTMLEILNSPVRAYHRAVGIYITEMCN